MNICPHVKCLEIEIEEEQFELIIRYLLLNKTDSFKTKSSVSKESDIWPRKFFDLLSRTLNKKISSIDHLSTFAFNQKTSTNNLFLLCIFNPTYGMEQKLQRIINREKLLNDYSIGSVFNYLYLWW